MEIKARILTEDAMTMEEWDYWLYFVNIYAAQWCYTNPGFAQFETFERKKLRNFSKRR